MPFLLFLTACSSAGPTAETDGGFKVTANVVDRSGNPIDPQSSNPAPPTVSAVAGNETAPKTQPIIQQSHRELYFPQAGNSPENLIAEQLSADQAFLLGVARQRRGFPDQGMLSGQEVFAIYREHNGECVNIAVTYPAFYQAEIWTACPDGQVGRMSAAEDLPGLPEDPQFGAQRQYLVHRASAEGQAEALFGEYRVVARAIGAPGPEGCVIVETDVMWRGIVADVTRDPICMQPR